MPSWKVWSFIARHHFTFGLSIFAGYGWKHLPEGSLVVDVGGGVGSQSLTVASHHSQLRFVVQDRESVVGDAINVCAMNSPTRIWRALTNVLAVVLEEEHAGCARIWPGENPRFIWFICPGVGTRLTFLDSQKAQNFFEPQQAQYDDSDDNFKLEGVSVFLLSKVLHDWADEYCLIILKHLRAAAGPKTQLLVADQRVSFVCDEPAAHEIPGAERPVPPQPLLRNMGRAVSNVYSMDMLVRGHKDNSDCDVGVTDPTSYLLFFCPRVSVKRC
jgi:hypothetical protein